MSSSTDSFDADDVVAKGGTVRSQTAWDRVRANWQKQTPGMEKEAAAKRAASARRPATSEHEIERCLDTGEAFPQPVPLSIMVSQNFPLDSLGQNIELDCGDRTQVDLLMELWEDEGLFDKF